jgi:hypothetical protein
MKIVRKENGNVLLTDDSGNTIKRLPEHAVLELKSDTEGEFVRVAYGHQNKHDIYANQITDTQVEPDIEVSFSGTGQDLLNLLSTDFFFDLDGGGGVDTNFANTDLVLDDDRSHDGNELGFAFENIADFFLQAIDQLELASNDVLILNSINELRLFAQSLRISIPSADAVGKVLTLNNTVTKEVEFTDISGLGANIYNANGALTGNREVDIDGNELSFTNFQLFEISSGVNLEIQSQQAAIEIDEDLEVTTTDTTLNSENLDIITDIFRLNIPSADAVGKVLAVTNATSKEVEFINPPTTGGNAIFQEQDATTTSAGALFVTRHTFNGNLDVGSYEISFFTYMGAGGAFAELRNGILINGVVEYDRGFSTFFVVEQAYPNTFILDVTTAGVFNIQAQFRRVTAGVTVDCNFSNLIIKKIA